MLRQRGLQPLATNSHSAAPPLQDAPQRSLLVSAASGQGEISAISSAMETTDDPHKPLLGDASLSGRHGFTQPPLHKSIIENEDEGREDAEMDYGNMSAKSQWIVLAVASGACAAFNGVFAKLTTTELTTSFATGIANLIGLSKVEKGVEVVVRAIFFALNLIFNGIMWALFTKALARGTSTTQVSILNTSSNFMITALLGLIIFSESLSRLWFLGAALLVAGNVIIGRRDEGEDKKGIDSVEDRALSGSGLGHGGGRFSNEEETGALLSGVSVELDEASELERKRRRDDEDILILGSDGEEEDDHVSSQRLI